jgi:hypothetical protein
MRPRYRRRKPQRPIARTALTPGLYVNKRSNIVHLVEDGGVIRGVQKIRADQWVPSVVPQVTELAARPRVRLQNASRWFEALALSRLKQDDADAACRLLLDAVGHDLVRVRQARHPILQARPSPPPGTLAPSRLQEAGTAAPVEKPEYRLYDLLAAIAVRYERPIYAQRLRLLVSDGHAVPLQLYERAFRWREGTGWWQRWRKDGSRRQWAGLPM